MALDYDIVIATRNRAKALKLALPLMLAQSRRASHMIIVDSSDDPDLTKAAVDNATMGTGVKVEFHTSKPGTSTQRNIGLERVRSPVVMFPDDDSLWFEGVAEAIMRVYERDTGGLIGAVCSAASTVPPEGILEHAQSAYKMTMLDWLRERFGTQRAKLENRMFPDPFILFGRERWSVLPTPDWLEDENCVPVEWMTGFRMSFRTESIRREGFDETLGQYALFEDTDASFNVMRDQLVVGARNAHIYHYRVPGPRGDGLIMGAVQLLNRAYVVCKHAEPGSLPRRRLKRYGRYKLGQYFTGGRSEFGHDRVIGAKRALKKIDHIIAAPPDRLAEVYLDAKSICLKGRAARPRHGTTGAEQTHRSTGADAGQFGPRPVVSIGLPVYNGENFLRTAIESILSQTYDNLELIISDNASTDATEQICRSYASQDARVRYIRHGVNRGASFNFNYVVQEARGRYFKWHAHDDGCLPGYLAACVEAFEAAPDSVVLCQCRTVLIDEDGRPYADYGQERENIEHDRPHRRLQQLIDELRLCTYVFGLIRTETLRQTRLIDRFVSADVVLLVELVLRGKFLMLQEFSQLRRVHPESSRFRNVDVGDLREWFDPNAKGVWINPRLKYGVECLRSIRRAPLPMVDRMRCFAAFMGSAVRRRSASEARGRSRTERELAESGAPCAAGVQASRSVDSRAGLVASGQRPDRAIDQPTASQDS